MAPESSEHLFHYSWFFGVLHTVGTRLTMSHSLARRLQKAVQPGRLRFGTGVPTQSRDTAHNEPWF